MLLDMQNDPHQLKNLAQDPQYAATVAEMSALIQRYHASALPRPAAAAA
jgi:hypothetical protein